MIELIFAAVLVAGTIASTFTIVHGMNWWLGRASRRRLERDRRIDAERRVAARRRELGLPPHERCLCKECRAWRSVPGNQERLRLRGRR